MKILGSILPDTLVGTAGADTIIGASGNDLIATAGGRDQINAGDGDDMITGFAFDLDALKKSDTYRAVVNGGEGFDTIIVELLASNKTTFIAKLQSALGMSKVDDFIYNISGASADQYVIGTEKSETLCLGDGPVLVKAGTGHDYLYSGTGADVIDGEKGNDFISAGDGHNLVTGGGGKDYFHFQLSQSYQYTEIADYSISQDKIAITIDVAQINLLYSTDLESPGPVNYYGDGYYGVGAAINDYVSYNNGRLFDKGDFIENSQLFDDFVIYDASTGSLILNYFVQTDDGIAVAEVLVAQLADQPDLDSTNFVFYIV